jgi:hypothetical protein
MRTTCRLLGRSNDQALAAQSAAIVVPRWRIGFLVMPAVISIAPMWCFSDMVPRRLLANHNLVGGCVHLSDFFDKIKTECVKARLTQRCIARRARVSILFHSAISERAVRVPRAQQPAPAGVSIGDSDLGGAVTSARGPEAGVRVIADVKW